MYIPPIYTRTGTIITPELRADRGPAFKPATADTIEVQKIKTINPDNSGSQKLLAPPTDGRGSRVDILV
ncbi:hypothetical protein [uncultured Kiloniella sp.]|uniref:hypothetical protein n=1 Tax=uncultured Kiloniella sp. TaxID=1133091 RepID=UPI0026379BF0|nr:hypothetical protein [uncultured Kiloniella sp.]